MSNINEIGSLLLNGTNKGKIIIANITEPYGKNTEDVLSIGIALNGQDVQWKAHIPYENLDEVISILQKARETKR